MAAARAEQDAASGPGPTWLVEAVDQAADLLFLSDARDRFAYVNRRSAALLGLAPGELTGETVVSVVLPDDHAALLDALRAVRLGESTGSEVLECRLVGRRAPEGLPVEITLAPVVIEHRTVGCIGIARSLAQRSDRLAQRLASERVAAIGDLANQAADRINNPLAVLVTHVGNIERAARHGKPANAESIEQMRNAIARVADVTEELATIADTSIQKLLLGRSIADLRAGVDAAQPSNGK